MSFYKDYFLTIINFLKLHENLINCHLVDFLTKSLWEECLQRDLKLYIEEKGCSTINEIKQFDKSDKHQDSELLKFLKDIDALKLENCYEVLARCDFLNVIHSEKSRSMQLQSKFMKVKKWHEVEVYSNTVAWLNQNKSSIIIDAGAGKGYSSLYLSTCYNLPVLAIECSQINHRGAMLHSNLINKKSKESTSLVRYAVETIDETTDFVKMVKNYFPDLYPNKEVIITALHACGSLTDSVIKSFLSVGDIKKLCIVPCCYHLASKSFLNTYKFSKNLRMLAQQSSDRTKQKIDSLSPSLFYRAVFQVILQSMGIEDAKVGRGAPLDNFLNYAKWALRKVHPSKIPSDEMIQTTYEKYESLKWKFHVFQLLRIQLAPVIEAAIILDKVLFMQNAKVCTNLQVVQLFDPLLSPRNWAIIATK